MSDEPNVTTLFARTEEADPPQPRGTSAVAVAIVIVRGVVELGKHVAEAALYLLAAVGLLTLVGS